MSELRDRMTNSPRKTHIFRQTAEMISAFIADMGGVKGFTLRSAISAAQRARPDLLDSAAHRLLPDFLEALEPLFQSWDPSAVSSFEQYLKQNPSLRRAPRRRRSSREQHQQPDGRLGLFPATRRRPGRSGEAATPPRADHRWRAACAVKRPDGSFTEPVDVPSSARTVLLRDV